MLGSSSCLATPSPVLDMTFQPTTLDGAGLLATAHVGGKLLIQRLQDGQLQKVDMPGGRQVPQTIDPDSVLKNEIEFDSPVWNLAFNSHIPNLIACGTRSGRVRVVDTEPMKTAFENASFHAEGSVEALMWLDANSFVSADMTTGIAIWDSRQRKKCGHIGGFEDTVWDLEQCENQHMLFVSMGDQIGLYDLRKARKDTTAPRRDTALVAMSDHLDDDVHTITAIRDGRNLAAGLSSGVVAVFDATDIGDYKERINDQIPPYPLRSALKIDEGLCLYGSECGSVYAINFQPNKSCGAVAQRRQESCGVDLGDCAAIDAMTKHPRLPILALADSMEDTITFHDISNLRPLQSVALRCETGLPVQQEDFFEDL